MATQLVVKISNKLEQDIRVSVSGLRRPGEANFQLAPSHLPIPSLSEAQVCSAEKIDVSKGWGATDVEWCVVDRLLILGADCQDLVRRVARP